MQGINILAWADKPTYELQYVIGSHIEYRGVWQGHVFYLTCTFNVDTGHTSYHNETLASLLAKADSVYATAVDRATGKTIARDELKVDGELMSCVDNVVLLPLRASAQGVGAAG